MVGFQEVRFQAPTITEAENLNQTFDKVLWWLRECTRHAIYKIPSALVLNLTEREKLN
ncbi:unnamed protein product [Sphenostylis stenocarpa]|uniref:Uncharacterized protein n=1 Tax=Sphenostylis stenocarpa TaxID=92480 RepID=A0AA86SV52_9FABA|nr:unnamed protein product [Sphenostylis stenocarpa]